MIKLKFRDEVNDALNSFFASQSAHFSSGLERKMFEQIQDFTMRGGKRFRPMIAMQMYYCFDHQLRPEQLAQAVLPFELVQTYLLIHDDIMDHSLMRRGKPTVHAYFRQEKDEALGMPFDEETSRDIAMLTGNMADALARASLYDAPISDNKKVQLMQLIDRMLILENIGQADDKIGENKELSSEQILNIYFRKTVPYTTEFPMLAGAVLGDAQEPVLSVVDAASKPLGLAFQICDDLIDLYSSSVKTGKEFGLDIKTAKCTYLIARARETAEGREVLRTYHSIFGNPQASDDAIIEFGEALKQTGLIGRIEDENKIKVANALHLLEHQVRRPSDFERFSGLAHYLAERDS